MSSSRLGNLFERRSPNVRGFDGQTDNNNTVLELPTTNLGVAGTDASKFEENCMADETFRDYEIARKSCDTIAHRHSGFYVGGNTQRK